MATAKVTARVLVDRGEVARLLDDLVRRLDRIEQKVDRLLGDEAEELCPACGNDDFEDTTCMGEDPRLTCVGERGCGHSWRPVNGEA